MGGFFGVASKEACNLDLFMEQIIIRILEPAAEVWLLMEVMVGRERFIILKIRRSVQNLKKMLIQ